MNGHIAWNAFLELRREEGEDFLFVRFVGCGDFGECLDAPDDGDEGALIHGVGDCGELLVDFFWFLVCDCCKGYHGAPDHAVILALEQTQKLWRVLGD